MSRRTIPSTVEVHCDRCGQRLDLAYDGSYIGGRLIVARSDGDCKEFDLCDPCMNYFNVEFLMRLVSQKASAR